jgi:protein-tyrosine phosphatase
MTLDPVPFARELPCDAIHNLRDYGGYPARNGRVVVGRLYRSAQHFGATRGDLERVAGLRLLAVVDLRSPAERTLAPCPRPDGFAAQVIYVDEDTTGIAPHIKAAETTPTVEGARAAMLAGYRGMPFRSRLLPVLQRYFETLADADGATLVHCMAGKDRTGFAVALLHHALGVHRDDLMADYLLTNTAGRARERVAEGARQLRLGYGDSLSDEVVETLMGVAPEYLDAAFAAIEAEYGTVDAYLEARLGLTPARRTALEARLVA